MRGSPVFSPSLQTEDEQQAVVKEVFHMVSKRDDSVCNFLEGPSKLGGGDFRLIYRHYATLYFVFCVDTAESELGILDLIQVRSPPLVTVYLHCKTGKQIW